MTERLSVLFVCTANICRSAYAQVRAEQLLADDPSIRVSSAGVYGWENHPLDAAMAAEALARGADPSAFRSRPLRPALLSAADLVLTAEAAHRSVILRDWPSGLRRVFTFAQFAEGIGEADPNLAGRDLVAWVGERRPAMPASGDVPDPYRRGPDAARRAADRLDALLGVILPRLRAPDGSLA